ncbi:HAD-IA family hydrolase [Leptobacterium flavescens]|uniref:HAD-IA family hydrolase n=1 Tax=Leptobacterium flavescens TaxID=472055 RepID=A0A6P0UJ09_9FLAO|nr:HAD family phosphatase [Leptobacterium flavescens]NER13295.1 HAD-IA family hydrolase [Leptobacterium flavescens]
MIKNIIFDFGDIFIDLDKQATLKHMQLLGLKEVTAEMTHINHDYERGLVSTTEFVGFYKNLFPNASEKELEDAWNAIILDFPEYRLDFIESLARENNYRLFLLSNTNELHIKRVIERMGKDRYDRFYKCFEQFYLSHEIQLRKPDKEIYEFVMKQNGLKESESFFIDDTEENTRAAEAMGIRSWNLIPGVDDITKLFNLKELIH